MDRGAQLFPNGVRDMRDFIDKDHGDVMDVFYDISEQLHEGVGSKAKIKKDLIKLINKDPYFFDSYWSK